MQKNIAFILIAVFVTASVTVFPQDQETPRLALPDSIKIDTSNSFSPRFQLYMQGLSIVHPDSEQFDSYIYQDLNLYLMSLENPDRRISFLHKDYTRRNDFLSPLYSKYKEDSKVSPFAYVLGLAEGAATAYLAYESIRKYGFWDKKEKKK